MNFGGPNDDGGDLLIGLSATLNFTVDLADYVEAGDNGIVLGSFVLTMVANPEPASLALAGFAIPASGAGYTKRRRKKKLAENAVTRYVVGG